MVTLEDVAQAAGVSTATVSRIVNGTAQVSADKRARVLAAIARLGYEPNTLARGLARGRSMTVGVLTQDPSGPYYGRVFTGVEQGLYSSGYVPMLASGYWRPELEREALHMLVARRVDGLIVIVGNTPVDLLHTLRERMPLIVVGRKIEGLEDRCISVNHQKGAWQATKHLTSLGHRQIAHVAGLKEAFDAQERLSGYQKALSEAGIPFDLDLVVDGDYSEAAGVRAVETLLSRGKPFTAVFCANDQMAYGVLHGLSVRGIRVPEEVSVVGFDDAPHSEFTVPALTTVQQPTVQMGVSAAKALVTLLSERPLRKLAGVPLQLVVRGSTAPAPVPALTVST